MTKLTRVTALCLLLSAGATMAYADSSDTGHGAGAQTLLWFAILLLVAKLAALVERWGQPAVLGELLAGVALGNLGLVGVHWFEPALHDLHLKFIAEFGVIILLFLVGLESNVGKMLAVGPRAMLVACIGVVLPFGLALMVSPLLLPGLSWNTYLFIGAALTATSVGITARVFSDLKKLQMPEAQIVLGAAVIDDVLGLIILAVVSSIVVTGSVSVGTAAVIITKAVVFLVVAVGAGQVLAKPLGRMLSRVHTGTGMKLAMAMVFCLGYAYAAHAVGLAPIVGAFAAGLVLDAVHFTDFDDSDVVTQITAELGDDEHSNDSPLAGRLRQVLNHQRHRHVEDLVQPLNLLFPPVFFVLTGMAVKLDALANPRIVLVALVITAVAFIGKILCGLAAGPNVSKAIVGWGMVPRGEVGLIFAATGMSLGVMDNATYSVVVIMVILTTLVPPVVLNRLLRHQPT